MGWSGGVGWILKIKSMEVCLQANSVPCTGDLKYSYEKLCLFHLLTNRVKDTGTNHKGCHLPAVILTLSSKVRPHVKPSYPDKGNQEYF